MTSTAMSKLFDYLTDEQKQVAEALDALGTDEKLAALYYIYVKMGDSITPAAPTSADPELAPKLLDDFYKLDDERQLAIMREIVNQEETEYSRYYGALTENNRLVVWYAWAKGMGNSVVDLPESYSASPATKQIVGRVEKLDFQGQISILRAIAADMGYSEIQPIPSQAETGKTSSL